VVPEGGFAEVNGLAEIRDPTLVVAGDLDRPEVGARAELLAGSIPVAQMEVMNGTAHVPSMEKPGEFNRVVFEFLRGVSASEGGRFAKRPYTDRPYRYWSGASSPGLIS
jgi:hypothetical protein